MTTTKLTKLGHSCVRLERDGRTLLFDPGVFSDAASALVGADAVLITHEHADHIDADAVLAAATADPELRIWAPAGVVRSLTDSHADLAARITAAEPDTAFEAAGFAVRTFGGQHAIIHPSIPAVANVAYLVDDSVYHPGDSFTVPATDVQVALLPIHAPWSKLAEVVDFAIAVRAPRTFQIHDGLLNDIGRGMVEGQVTRLSAPFGSTFAHLDVDASVELD